jgi:ethanolamine utilization protein EutQ (cupin superfamily)
LNSRLVGRDAAAQDVAVNLLIVDGKLSVVTKDELVVKPGDVASIGKTNTIFT